MHNDDDDTVDPVLPLLEIKMLVFGFFRVKLGIFMPKLLGKTDNLPRSLARLTRMYGMNC